jgi:hypothetical protein
MKSLKNIFKLSGMICLIVLASVGIGIGGGIPVVSTKKEDRIEIKTEVPESKEESSEILNFDVKQ